MPSDRLMFFLKSKKKIRKKWIFGFKNLENPGNTNIFGLSFGKKSNRFNHARPDRQIGIIC